MEPTEKQISAAHDAWEQAVTEWQVRQANSPDIRRGETWLVERRAGGRYESGRDYTNEIAYHRFDGEGAQQRAKFFLRDKCIRAALTAALAAT
jgi:hypothetical protein